MKKIIIILFVAMICCNDRGIDERQVDPTDTIIIDTTINDKVIDTIVK